MMVQSPLAGRLATTLIMAHKLYAFDPADGSSFDAAPCGGIDNMYNCCDMQDKAAILVTPPSLASQCHHIHNPTF
jgi:hypothetical protein